jgi:hypothetical protein
LPLRDREKKGGQRVVGRDLQDLTRLFTGKGWVGLEQLARMGQRDIERADSVGRSGHSQSSRPRPVDSLLGFAGPRFKAVASAAGFDTDAHE